MVRIRTVRVLDGFRVKLGLTDGREKDIDLDPYLHGPIFEPLRKDRKLFESVRVDDELGTIVWPNGADIDPDVLCAGRTPAAWEAEGSAAQRS